MEVIAHRGYAAAFPENTLAAFRGAARTADWIELDVRRCGSGELVVFHDETLDRCTGATGPVVCTPWRDLRELTVLDSGEGIPRLREAFEAIPEDVGVLVELKDLGLAADVRDVARAHGNPWTAISFSLLALQELRAAAPDAPSGYILHGDLYQGAPALGVETAAHLGCRVIHPPYAMGTDPDVIDLADEHGLAVHAATPEEGPTEAVLETCRSAGVDRIVVDRTPG
ncbi:MAG: glycerophosphodiester phosphodiesterase [Halodesulfurarchaeum sp.]